MILIITIVDFIDLLKNANIVISLVIPYFHSYRIENIFNENIQQMPKNIKQYIFYNKLIQAVYVHRRAIELVLVYIL